MARVHIDISVFTPNSNIGVVNGPMVVDSVPLLGDFVTFDKPTNLIDIPSSPPRLEVEHVLAPPDGSQDEAVVMLADLTLPTREEAQSAVAYLQAGFGLHFDDHSL